MHAIAYDGTRSTRLQTRIGCAITSQHWRGNFLRSTKSRESHALMSSSIIRPKLHSNPTCQFTFCQKLKPTDERFLVCLLIKLILRGHDIDGNLDTRQERLRMPMKDETSISRLSKEIAHGEVKEGAYFLLMHTLPYILHMKNRNGIKILSMLFVEGISNAKKKLSYTDINAEGIRVSRFISNVKDVINRSILGTNNHPSTWICPFDIKKKEL